MLKNQQNLSYLGKIEVFPIRRGYFDGLAKGLKQFSRWGLIRSRDRTRRNCALSPNSWRRDNPDLVSQTLGKNPHEFLFNRSPRWREQPQLDSQRYVFHTPQLVTLRSGVQ